MQQTSIFRSRTLVFFLFLITVNLLSGVAAVSLNYPSLFNIEPSFGEYAFPVPFTWALAHWPSMLIFGLPLLKLSRESGKLLLGYRWLCLLVFCALLTQLGERNPFVLFAAVDTAVGLTFTLALIPPNRRSNPVLFFLCGAAGIIAILSVAYVALDSYQHRTPALSTTAYNNGTFMLTSIDVNKAFHEIRLNIDLTERLDSATACLLGQEMATQVLQDYPFDSSYNKLIEVWFNPLNREIPENNGSIYPLGEISLNESDKGPRGNFPCSLRYK